MDERAEQDTRPEDDPSTDYDAVVLAGGSARRLDGAAKPQLRVGSSSLLDHALAAVADAHTVVVAGPRQAVATAVTWVREHPAGAGPVAALSAALPSTHAATVVVLAADLPWIAPAVPALRDALAAAPASVAAAALADPDGRVNHLAAAWRRCALQAAVHAVGDPVGAAMRRLVDDLEIVTVADDGGWGADCDTWDDVAAARARSGSQA